MAQMKPIKRMTIPRPGSVGGYTLPLCRAGEWRAEHNNFYGDFADRLGQFEDLGMEPEEIKRDLEAAEHYRKLIKHWEQEKK